MKKIKKYFYGILLAVIMLSIPKSLVSAASKDQVQNAIQELVNVYPNSCSYFTSDGKIDSNNADSRCALENIPSRGGLPSGSTVQNAYGSKCWSCHAFAEYAWYVIFGHCTNTQTKTISKSELQVGDFIRFSGHSAIYLGENDQYYYVLDSNWASPADNKVRYNHTISKSRGIEACYHATNYDEVTEISNSPVGAVDKIEGNQGSISVYGWAYDLDDVNASLEIHVYIGGEAGSGAECHVINAAEASPDLSPVVGNHRFASTIETSLEGNQPVYIYAINIGSGENVLIGSGNAVITQKNITFEPSTTENITSSNATITAWGRNKGTMQELGFYFGMDGEYQNQSRIVVSKDVSWTDFCMKYEVNTYYGVLNPGQKYRYAFFCVKDGQEYKSDESVFTTAGSAGISFDSLNAADVTSESATIHCWGNNSNRHPPAWRPRTGFPPWWSRPRTGRTAGHCIPAARRWRRRSDSADRPRTDN